MHDLEFEHLHVDPADVAVNEVAWAADNVELTTVGIDIGSSTSHLMFARVHLQRLSAALSSRFVVVERKILWQSPILLTPYRGDYTIDVDELNERWRELAAVDVWSQLVMKEPEDRLERIQAAPRTGQWHLHEDGTFTFRSVAVDWHPLHDEADCFFLRVYGPGDFRFKGADLGILVTKGRLQTDEPNDLTERCRRFIQGIRSQYVGAPVGEDVHPMPISYLAPSSF